MQRQIDSLVKALSAGTEAVILGLLQEPVSGVALEAYLEANGWVANVLENHPDLLSYVHPIYARRQLNFPRDESTSPDFQEVMNLMVEKLAELEKRPALLILNDLRCRKLLITS